MWRRILAYAALLATPALYAAEPDPAPDAPLDLELEERVAVQLVLIDAIVLDRDDRTVAGLEADDFDLLVDDDPVEIETFDAACPGGGLDDPPVGASRRAIDATSGMTRRYVFVVDYYHLGGLAVEVLGYAREAILRLGLPGEEYMLISLGQSLRVEVPFTRDAQEVVTRLDGMIADRDLYFGYYDRLTERRWYDRILTLLDLMELVPGQKAVVLFSGPLLEDGWSYDETFDEIAAMASRSRTSFYPVDTRGLTLDGIMGPASLRRLAVETGGRATGGTNDLARAFARAQRDLGCQYTIGFRDSEPKLDRERKVRLFVRDRGYRVLHPTHYVIRSEKEERRSLTSTAARVPEMFSGQGLEIRMVLGRPVSTTRWAAIASLEIDPSVFAGVTEDASLTVRMQLRKSNGTLHRGLQHEREVELPAPGTADPFVVFETFEPRPGSYELQVIVSGADLEEPLATNLAVRVPPIPD